MLAWEMHACKHPYPLFFFPHTLLFRPNTKNPRRGSAARAAAEEQRPNGLAARYYYLPISNASAQAEHPVCHLEMAHRVFNPPQRTIGDQRRARGSGLIQSHNVFDPLRYIARLHVHRILNRITRLLHLQFRISSYVLHFKLTRYYRMSHTCSGTPGAPDGSDPIHRNFRSSPKQTRVNPAPVQLPPTQQEHWLPLT